MLAWDDLLAGVPLDLDAAAAIAQPEDIATVIYTSGTTGPPKGVMLDHQNICWTIESLRLALGDLAVEGRRVVSYLPMAHIAERMTSHYQGVALGYEVSTCPEGGQIAQYLPEVRPEIFFAVPRVWEKMHSGIMAMAAADPERKEQLEAALGIGLKASDYRARGEELPDDLRAEWEAADREGLALVRSLIGLDECIAAISGAAPIAVEVFDFFRALGVPISEIYGMSESSGPMTWAPFRIKAGTVGPEIPGSEVRLAEDGEVICRGGNVFRGLPQRPGEDGRRARRGRLAALRRHRRVRRRRVPAHRRPQEGADHHRGRQERLAREPRGRAEGPGAHRPGVRDRRRPAVHLRARRARPRRRAGVGEPPRHPRDEPRWSWRTTPRSWRR